MPNLIAYDMAGVQPMSGPTGLIFAMRAMYDGPQGPNEALFDEADPSFSGNVGGLTAAGTEYTYPNGATIQSWSPLRSRSNTLLERRR